jgi:4-amino-4-deoxy-L-arabinose transferase-like glycosyltransferase
MKLTYQRPILFFIAGLGVSIYLAVSKDDPAWCRFMYCLAIMSSGFLLSTFFLEKLQEQANLMRANMVQLMTRNLDLTARNLELQGQVNDLNRQVFLQEKK